MFCTFTLAIIIIIIIIIINCRGSQHNTTAYKTHHEELQMSWEMRADEGRISMGQGYRHHERTGQTPYSLRCKNS